MNHNDHIGRYDLGVSMISEVSAVNLRQNLGEMLNHVQYRNDSIVINKDGKPVAALVDAELFTRIRRMRERFDALSGRLAEAYADVAADEGTTEIDAAVASERRADGWAARGAGHQRSGVGVGLSRQSAGAHPGRVAAGWPRSGAV